MTEQEAQELVHDLFSGTTCYVGYIKVEAIYGDYVLVHHKSHPEWINRMSGLQTCEAYHALVHKDMKRGSFPIFAEREAVLYISGRLNKEKRALIAERAKQPYKQPVSN
jgi:hypothetical protein